MGARGDASQLGVVGLGSFGRLMARRLVRAGHAVAGYDILAAARESAAAEGIAALDSPGAVARRCDCIILSLPSSHEVEQACFGSGGLMAGARRGTLVIDTTSGDPVRSREIARRLAEAGVEFIDAGVSGTGGPDAAEAGTLTIMVGATPEQFERARPVLSHLGRQVVRIGPLGAGHLAKSLNNMLLATAMFATAEAVATGIKAGLDPAALVQVLQASTGRNFCTEYRFPEFVLKGDFSPRSGGRLALLDKDVAQAVALGKELGVPMAVAGNVHQMLRIVVAELGPDVPSTHLIRRFEDWAGISFSAPAPAPTHSRGD